MSLTSIPAFSIPAVTLIASFIGASVGVLLFFGSYKLRTVLAAMAVSAFITLAGLLGYCSFTNEPYFVFHTEPVSDWGGLALFIYEIGVAIGGLALGFTITAVLRLIGHLQQNARRPERR
jgi:hypothetical protein